ncbi:hypothetical protein [Terasakiella sp.]|uniref:hypothetical protein n=1 Tax=Terasakiella sp. TaxID=2034861 RepID=UPI003AA82E0A
MTYQVHEDSIHARVRRVMQVVGKAQTASLCGVTTSRLEQLANPRRPDLKTSELCIAMDVACAKAGGGTPLFDLYAQRLSEAGVLDPVGTRYFGLVALVRKVVEVLRGAADALDEAIGVEALQPSYARG